MFADASKVAHGTEVFLQVQNMKYGFHLVKARARVAPIKEIIINRLELFALLILTDSIKKNLKIYSTLNQKGSADIVLIMEEVMNEKPFTCVAENNDELVL